MGDIVPLGSLVMPYTALCSAHSTKAMLMTTNDNFPGPCYVTVTCIALQELSVQAIMVSVVEGGQL